MSAKEDRQVSSQYIQSWANTIDEGYVPRIMITAQRHQMGKTATMMRINEKFLEEVLGRKFHIDNLGLTCLEVMERRKIVPEWTPLDLDEPERPLGNKSNWDLEAQYFVEDLMTSPFHHIPVMFALPHAHFLNVSVYGVLTSQIVKLNKSECETFEIQRDQLNRSLDVYTPKRGHFRVGMPYAWDWKDYCEKRDKFDTRRGKVLEEKVRLLHTDTRDLDKEQVYLMVKADLRTYTDKRKGNISPGLIETKLGVSYASARYAAKKANSLQDEILKAEADKLGSED